MALFKISFGSNKADSGVVNEAISRYADSSSIDDDERKYYQPDEYYTLVAHQGTVFERAVITFDERCKISFPSRRGLYVGEILLLHYCSLGKYPKPKGGYPGFWWFEYGIRDVGHALSSLAERGYLKLSLGENALKEFTVAELKSLAEELGLEVGGKKSEIIKTIIGSSNLESQTKMRGLEKYSLTEMGNAELEENAYVPYMHRHSHKTLDDNASGESFTVWDMNRFLQDKDISQWRKIVGEEEKKRFGVNIACGEEKNQKKKDTGNKQEYTTEEMRQYLRENKDKIRKATHGSGDGYEEERKGIDFRKIGEDKKALFNFYVSISKGFDAPALYRETMMLLRKYNMLEEELAVAEIAMRKIPKANKLRDELEKRMEKIQRILSNNNKELE